MLGGPSQTCPPPDGMRVLNGKERIQMVEMNALEKRKGENVWKRERGDENGIFGEVILKIYLYLLLFGLVWLAIPNFAFSRLGRQTS